MMSLDSICAGCQEPFQKTQPEQALCRDCLIAEIHRQAKEAGLHATIHRYSAMVVLVIAGAATCLCFIGWIWQGLQVLRLIFGGG
jgi:hypothetical protein